MLQRLRTTVKKVSRWEGMLSGGGGAGLLWPPTPARRVHVADTTPTSVTLQWEPPREYEKAESDRRASVTLSSRSQDGRSTSLNPPGGSSLRREASGSVGPGAGAGAGADVEGDVMQRPRRSSSVAVTRGQHAASMARSRVGSVSSGSTHDEMAALRAPSTLRAKSLR